jgi:hypothetical protein
VKVAKTVGIVSIIAGIVMILAGAGTWAMVSSQLAAEQITVPGDAKAFGGSQVTGPLTAYYQADIINTHALAATEGMTYAELGAEVNKAKEAGDQAAADEFQAKRNTVMNASFLRASLFTSVVSFGIAALVIGLGVMFGLIGWALMSIHPVVADRSAGAEPARVG